MADWQGKSAIGTMFRRRPYENELTRAIKRNDVSNVMQLLCHRELGPAASADAPDLIEFLNEVDPDENRPRRQIVVDWALKKGKYNTKEVMEMYKVYQVSRNAATLLSRGTGKNLLASFFDDDYLMQCLVEFPDGEDGRDPSFAAHWCSIMDRLLFVKRGSFERLKCNPADLIMKAIKNVDVLAYQTFLVGLVPACQDEWSQTNEYSLDRFMGDVLKEAARYVLAQQHEKSIRQGTTLCRLRSGMLAQFEPSKQPLNANKTPIPMPYYAQLKPNQGYSDPLWETDEFQKRRKARHDLYFTGVNEDEYKVDGEMKAYLLLMCIVRTLDGEYPDIGDVQYLPSLWNDECLRHLLICGIYSGDFSMVSHTAFKLLSWLLYGNKIDDVRDEENVLLPPPAPECFEKARKVIGEFAKDCHFNRELTSKMVSAFPIFWDNKDTSIKGDEEPEKKIEYHYCNSPYDLEFPVTPLKTGPHTLVLAGPETPFELYSCHLVYEPPVSDRLNYEVMKKVRSLDEQSRHLRTLDRKAFKGKEFKDWLDHQEKLTSYDIRWLKFLVTKFPYEKSEKVDMKFIKHAIPFVPEVSETPSNDDRVAEWLSLCRTALNGYIIELCMFIMRSQMFMFNGQPTPLQMLKETPSIMDDHDIRDICNRYERLGADFYSMAKPSSEGAVEKALRGPLEDPDFPYVGYQGDGEPCTLRNRTIVSCVTSDDKGGFHQLELCDEDGQLKQIAFSKLPLVNYACYSRDRRFVYGTCEGKDKGTIVAFKVVNGQLRYLNKVCSGGNAPCHLSCNASNTFLYVANYGENGDAAFVQVPLESDGKLSESGHRPFRYEGSGPVKDRQDRSHVHCACVTPNSQFVVAVDLGTDSLNAYQIDETNGITGDPIVSKVPPGSGPRHILFESSGAIAYVVTELGNTVISMAFDNNGHFEQLQIVSTIPSFFSGSTFASAIKFTPNGEALVVSNRGYDSIALIAIDNQGSLEVKSITYSEGQHPRDIEFLAKTYTLAVANRLTNNISLFEFQPNEMTLRSLSVHFNLPSPVACLS